MAAAEWGNRTIHRTADRPLHHDCRGQRQMGVGSRLNPSRCSWEMARGVRISLAYGGKAAGFFALVLLCVLAWAGARGRSTTPVRVLEDSVTIPTSEEGL